MPGSATNPAPNKVSDFSMEQFNCCVVIVSSFSCFGVDFLFLKTIIFLSQQVDIHHCQGFNLSITVPIATYLLGPVNEHQHTAYGNAVGGGDLCDNVSCLGM